MASVFTTNHNRILVEVVVDHIPPVVEVDNNLPAAVEDRNLPGVGPRHSPLVVEEDHNLLGEGCTVEVGRTVVVPDEKVHKT